MVMDENKRIMEDIITLLTDALELELFFEKIKKTNQLTKK